MIAAFPSEIDFIEYYLPPKENRFIKPFVLYYCPSNPSLLSPRKYRGRFLTLVDGVFGT